MIFYKFFLLVSFGILNSKSYIIGPEKEIKNHPKYSDFTKNETFQSSNLIIVIDETDKSIAHLIRPSRNIFGYTKYTIKIFQNEHLIFLKTFRLSSFDSLKKSLISFNQKKHDENRIKIVNYAFDLLLLTDYSDSNKVSTQLNQIRINEPTSNLILFNENGNMKAINLHLKDFHETLTKEEPLDVIPYILNKHDIKLVKSERIYNHGVYSYLLVNKTQIKLPNKNYAANLYKTFLKIEAIYLQDPSIFEKDTSLFFIEFDKLSSKSVKDLIAIKTELKKKLKGKYI